MKYGVHTGMNDIYGLRLSRWVLAHAVLLFLLGGAAVAEEPTSTDGGWQFRFAPYAWLPSLGGTLKFDLPPAAGGGSDLEVDVDQLIDALQTVFMGQFEVRKNKWSLMADVIYLDLGGGNTQVFAPVVPGGSGTLGRRDLNLRANLVTLTAGYEVLRTDTTTMDLIAGARYFGLDADVEVTTVSAAGPSPLYSKQSQSVDIWDAVVGIKGSVGLNDRWYLPYNLDVGTGDSDLTWNAFGGVGYRYGWGDVVLFYRHLAYRGGKGLVDDLYFSGPGAGVNFDF